MNPVEILKKEVVSLKDKYPELNDYVILVCSKDMTVKELFNK